MATQPELAGLLNLVSPVQAQLPSKNWEIRLTDQSNRTTILSGLAVMKNFKILDTGLGSVQIQYTLEFLTEQDIGTQAIIV